MRPWPQSLLRLNRRVRSALVDAVPVRAERHRRDRRPDSTARRFGRLLAVTAATALLLLVHVVGSGDAPPVRAQNVPSPGAVLLMLEAPPGTAPGEGGAESEEPDEWVRPADYERVDRVIIGWHSGNWVVVDYFTRLALEVTREVPLVVAGEREDRMAFVAHLVANGVPADRIEELEATLDSMWIRDYGPMFVRDRRGELQIVDLPYHGDRRADDELPVRVAERERRPATPLKIPLEGGHFHTDGEGRCVLSEDVLAVAIDDGRFDQEALEEAMRSRFGCRRVTYIPALVGEETGHIDVYSMVTGPGAILVGQYGPRQDRINAPLLEEAAVRLDRAGFSVTRVPMPSNLGRRVFRTYTNALALNDTVLVPVYRDAPRLQRRAVAIVRRAFPGRRVVEIPSDEVIDLAGAIHCTTSTIPAGWRG